MWIDLDRTRGAALDAQVELIRQDGTVLARATGNNLADLSGALSTTINDPVLGRPPLGPMQLNSYDGGDFYTTNPNDAGMRVILPGTPGGDIETYYLRVSSEGGLTRGEYQLQLRLRQIDEKPGSIVQFADIRFATNGIEVSGLPFHSPLLGETSENGTDNDSVGNAQQLGNLLESDRNAISIAGSLSADDDVDFYQFNSDYASTIYGPSIERIPGVNAADKTWSTVFDIDYADGLTRADSSLIVFDGSGVPILIGRESNVADDQPAAGMGIDLSDLTRGSGGQLDPFIGPVSLPTGDGTGQFDYTVGVISNQELLSQLDQTFFSTPTNPLIRLEPVNSIKRIVEDHIGFQGYETTTQPGGTVGSRPVNPVETAGLFNVTDLSVNVRDFELSDIPLFVSVNDGGTTRLQTIDPEFGNRTTDIGQLSSGNNFETQDIVMRSDGTLWGYQRVDGYDSANNVSDNGTAGRLIRIDPGNDPTDTDAGTNLVTVIGNDNVLGMTPTPDVITTAVNNTTAGFSEITFTDDVGALTWERSGGVGDDAEYALYYAVHENGRDASNSNSVNSKLYRADPDNGSVEKDGANDIGERGDLQPAGVTFATGNIGVSDGTAPSATIRLEARAPGAAGNGITVNVVQGDFTDLVDVSVSGSTITLRLDDTPASPSAGAILDAINEDPQARRLVTAGLTSGAGAKSAVRVSRGLYCRVVRMEPDMVLCAGM